MAKNKVRKSKTRDGEKKVHSLGTLRRQLLHGLKNNFLNVRFNTRFSTRERPLLSGTVGSMLRCEFSTLYLTCTYTGGLRDDDHRTLTDYEQISATPIPSCTSTRHDTVLAKNTHHFQTSPLPHTTTTTNPTPHTSAT